MIAKEIGLLFTPINRTLVRSGLKTQTRRLMKGNPEESKRYCRFGNPPDLPTRYYIKEPVQILGLYDGDPGTGPWAEIAYLDDKHKTAASLVHLTDDDLNKLHARKDWRKPSSSMFMLKTFARTWLEGIRVWPERLGDMSEADANDEAVAEFDGLLDEAEICKLAAQMNLAPEDSRAWYAALWNSINPKSPWRPDLWVWAVQWKPIPPGDDF